MVFLTALRQILCELLSDSAEDATLCDLTESADGCRVMITLEIPGVVGKSLDFPKRVLAHAIRDASARQRLGRILRAQILVLKAARSITESLNRLH